MNTYWISFILFLLKFSEHFVVAVEWGRAESRTRLQRDESLAHAFYNLSFLNRENLDKLVPSATRCGAPHMDRNINTELLLPRISPSPADNLFSRWNRLIISLHPTSFRQCVDAVATEFDQNPLTMAPSGYQSTMSELGTNAITRKWKEFQIHPQVRALNCHLWPIPSQKKLRGRKGELGYSEK